MLFTVIICTRNRAPSLQRTLQSIVDAEGAQFKTGWEIIVVDNGSTDNTDAVIRSFVTKLPIRRIVESEAGLSRARNRGLAAARGDLLVWTDDDVIVQKGWLSAYMGASLNHPDTSIFGGRILPRFEAPVKTWFIEAAPVLAGLLGHRDFGDRLIPIKPPSVPYGGNYAIRRKVQLRRLYDPAVGVAPGRRRGGEETGVVLSLLADGETGLWVPDAVVHHVIPSRAQTAIAIYKYYEALGYEWPSLTPSEVPGLLFGATPGLWKELIVNLSLFLKARFIGGNWVPHLIATGRSVGTIRRWRSQPE